MDESSQLATPPQNNQPTNDQPAEPQVIDQSLNTAITEQEEQSLVNDVLGLPPIEGGNDGDDTPTSGSDKDGQQPEGSQPPDGQAPNPEDGQQPAQPGEQQPSEPAKTEPEAPAETTPELEAPDTTIQTDDLWVEVDKLVTSEDGSTKTEKVKLTFDPNNPNSFVPDDFQFVNDKQLADILEAKREMADLYKERQSEVEKAQQDYQEKKSAVDTRQAQLDAWDAEIDTMIDTGILEAPKAKPGTPEFKQDPTVQKMESVFKFMSDKNQELAKNGKPPINSFALAYNMHEADANKQAAEEAKQQEVKNKQQRGSMVGGSSAPAAGGSNKGHYVAGTYTNVQNVELDDEGNLIT